MRFFATIKFILFLIFFAFADPLGHPKHHSNDIGFRTGRSIVSQPSASASSSTSSLSSTSTSNLPLMTLNDVRTDSVFPIYNPPSSDANKHPLIVSDINTEVLTSTNCRNSRTSNQIGQGRMPVDITQLEYRQQFIRNMTREAWAAYSRHAWGQYDLQPLSLGKQEAWLEYSGQSLVGAMSTLWIMGLKDEFEQGRKWIEKEMIIDDRSLTKVGSLLSVYALSGDGLFKNKAREIADLYNPTGR